MNAETQREEVLFDSARNLKDPLQRQAFLELACAQEPELRAKIEALLAAESAAEFFFAESTSALKSAVENSSSAPASHPADGPPLADEQVGTCVGPYKLLQKIGEGGCGVVYMAEQEKPIRRRVALKIIKLGMDTKNVIARFEAERQALAMMDHPNIARVFDAGALETGRPYFVMELVRGVKITDYCDANRLDTRRRLGLFVQVCNAIQQAHQKGVIHRDIKPSNVLVTLHDGVPVPKVIDFGIAKATGARLTDKTLFTAYEQIVGTPAYMSPEQAEMSGLDVDTRSDIYSLGVLLYELLTGRTPFDPKKLLQHGVDEMRRTLREQEPQRPSTMLTTLKGEELATTAEHHHLELLKLISLLRGDLDWIVMKALEKDRTRRYETANGLAMDISRYLNNEPVVARPPSRLYRFQKLVRRNKIVFAAGGAVAVALIIGLSTSTRLFFMEKAARQRAVAAEQLAEQERANEAQLRRLAETREKITQATVLLNQEKFDDADRLMSQVSVTQPTVEGAAVFRSLGEYYALQNQWQKAAGRFNVLLQIDQLDGWDACTLDYLRCGPALIELGDANGYEHFRQAAIARFTGGMHPFADRIVKISLLLPASKKLMKALEPLAEVTTQSFSTNADVNADIFLAAWRSVSLALMEYRRGNYVKAADWCQRCLNYPEHIAPRTATARVILAMSDQQLGKTGDARSELVQAREMIGNKFKSQLERGTPMQGFWFDWTFARILLREATGLISPVGSDSGTPALPSGISGPHQ
ncbi:MAG TPA: serine/threonine protein kinase [Verrucomicrobia subdivision 3 bacterium]|nr:serine/threonine protein kinase [Limisphaerales bacterium]